MAQDSDGEEDQEREAESGGNYLKWKSKSFVIAGVKLVLEKFFTNSECPFPQVAGDKRKRVTTINEEEEEDEDGDGGKPVKKRSSQAGGNIKSFQF